MLPEDQKIMKQIQATQSLIQEKEQIMSEFRELGYDLSGLQNQMLNNIHSRFTMGSSSTQKTMMLLDENIVKIKEDYVKVQTQKQYKRDTELDQR